MKCSILLALFHVPLFAAFFVCPQSSCFIANGELLFNRADSLKEKRHYFLTKAESAYSSLQFSQAIVFGELAVKKLDSLREVEDVVKAYNLLGSAHSKLRSFDKAIVCLQKGFDLGARYLRPGHILIGDSHFYLGQYYDLISEGDKSLNHHHRALDIRITKFGEDHLKVAESLKGIGEVYTFSFFNYKKAISFYHRSIKISESQLAPDHYELYVGYYNLGQGYRMLGDLDLAQTYAFKALSVVAAKKQHESLLSKCYALLADIAYGKTDFAAALEYRQKCIDQIEYLDGLNDYTLIQSYTNLGLIFSELNHLSDAISSFKRSLEILSKHHHANQRLHAQNFLHLGRSFQKSGNFDSAKHYLRGYLNLELSNFGSLHPNTSEAYRYLAIFFQNSNVPDSAAVYIQKSFAALNISFKGGANPDNGLFSEVKDQFQFFNHFADRGSILLDLYRSGNVRNLQSLTASLFSFKIADTLMQLSRNSYQQEGSKLFFADHYHNIYEKALQTSYLLFEKTQDEKYLADAQRFMERSKAFLLAESLHKAEIFTRAGVPDSLREMERSLNTALAAYRSQLETVHQKPNSETIQQRIQSQIFDISQKQEKLLDTIARLYPSYFQIKYQKLSNLDQIREYARKTNSTIIEYFWGEENVYALAISGKRLAFREITGVDSLTENVLEYFQALRRIPSLSDQNNSSDNFLTHAHSIYDLLLAPLLESDDENLVIVRDGPLLLVPFESLPMSKTTVSNSGYQHLDYLIRHHTISYAHSADLLLRNTSRIRTKNPQNKILAFSYSGLNAASGLATNHSMNELPGAAMEIQAISEILPGSFFLGDDATEEKFKTHAGKYDILHLAVHGKSDPEKQFSGTLYFKQAQNGQEDGELHVYELYELNLKARLAVLSACESGVGKIFRGEGVFNIARAFAYAGCPTTVMTLWPVSDMSSAEIMADFYTSLASGENVDAALREAKLNYLENADPNLAHPTYWAAYIPAGNMDPVIGAPLPIRTISILTLVAVTIFAVLLKYRHRRKLTVRQPVKI